MLERPGLIMRAGGRRLGTTPRWQLLLAGSGWLTWLATLLPAGSALRVALVFAFVLTCPGLALTLLMPVREAAARWVLAVALSMSVALLLNTLLTVLSNDSLPLRLAVLASLTTAATLIATPTAADEALHVTEEDVP